MDEDFKKVVDEVVSKYLSLNNNQENNEREDFFDLSSEKFISEVKLKKIEGKIIKLSSKANITELAKEYIKKNNIKIIYEDPKEYIENKSKITIIDLTENSRFNYLSKEYSYISSINFNLKIDGKFIILTDDGIKENNLINKNTEYKVFPVYSDIIDIEMIFKNVDGLILMNKFLKNYQINRIIKKLNK